MMVSIFMISYNHGKHIAQALDGIIMQQTNFDYELVIGDDYSTDNTRDIIREYQAAYPGKNIRLLDSDRNVGVHANVVRTLQACNGNYIAFCEGDDYWTSPLKLQKQVDFMEANPGCTICFHDVEVIYENINKKPFLMNQERHKGNVFTFRDVVRRYFEIATCSFMVRNFHEPLPTDILRQDWAILLYYSRGTINYLDEVMAVYRRHEGGFTSSYTSAKAIYITDVITRCRKYFAPRCTEDFLMVEGRYYADICFNYYREGNYAKFLEYYGNIGEYYNYLEPATRKALHVRQRLSRFPLLARNFARIAHRKQRFLYLFKKKA